MSPCGIIAHASAPGVNHLWLGGAACGARAGRRCSASGSSTSRTRTPARSRSCSAAFALWAAAMLALRVRDARGRARRAARALDRLEPFVDLAAITALTYTSGGPFSETAIGVLRAAGARRRAAAAAR